MGFSFLFNQLELGILWQSLPAESRRVEVQPLSAFFVNPPGGVTVVAVIPHWLEPAVLNFPHGWVFDEPF